MQEVVNERKCLKESKWHKKTLFAVQISIDLEGVVQTMKIRLPAITRNRMVSRGISMFTVNLRNLNEKEGKPEACSLD